MRSCIFIYDISFANTHSYTNTPYTFRSVERSSHSQNYHPKNNWPNFNDVTVLDDEEQAKEDIKEFAKLVEKSEKTWKPFSEELVTINLGTEQEEKELKSVPLLRLKKEKN